jgi:protein Mpv17
VADIAIYLMCIVNQDNLDGIIVGTGPREVVAKIFIDQLLWCPIFMICYFTYLGIWNGDSVTMIMSKIQLDLLTAVTTSWKIWPLAHAIQFRWVATKHRIIYINCIEVCFIMFLSFLANR